MRESAHTATHSVVLQSILHARPLYAPTVLLLYPFRFRDPVSGKWVRARYVAERHEIAARYAEWEIIDPSELRRPSGASIQPAEVAAYEWLLTATSSRSPSPHEFL